MLNRAPLSTLFAALALAAGTLPGCVTEDSRGFSEAPQRQPDWVLPTTMQVFAGAPRDTNGNNYVDSVTITVFLFDEQRYAAPITAPGSFSFRMTRADGRVLAEWSFTPEEAAKAQARMPPGPVYRFDLGLLSKGGDKLEPEAVDLTGTFMPVGGKPITTVGGATLRLGKISL